VNAPVSAPAGTEASGGAPAPNNTPVGLISSGTVTSSPIEAPVNPTSSTRSRPSSLNAAAEKVGFTVLEPADLPDTAHRDMIQLVEAEEGMTAPNTPAIRFIYTLEEGGTIVVLQSAATGEPGPGDPATIGGHDGWKQEEGTAVIYTWEQDGVRVELRGIRVSADVLEAAAASMSGADIGGADNGANMETADQTATAEAADSGAAGTPAPGSDAGGGSSDG
jgi:hypothetical protein